MHFIQIKIDLKQKQVTLYNLPSKIQIIVLPSLKKEVLGAYLKIHHWPLQGIMIDCYPPLLEVIHTLYPSAICCIHPESIKEILYKQKGFSKALERTQQIVLDEIAATTENKVEHEGDFFSSFYGCKTKEEAHVFYTLWQIHAPLNIAQLYSIVRKIEYYKEPIFNYFSFRKALAASK